MTQVPELLDIHDRSAVSTYIAQQLGETERQPQNLIWRIVRECGTEQALAWLDEAIQIEASGGMLTQTGQRRTLGGVFFRQVRDTLWVGDDAARARFRAIFWPRKPRGIQGTAVGVPQSAPLVWAERRVAWSAMEARSGTATALRLKLIGKPDRVVEKTQQTLLMLEHCGELPGMPKVIPMPPNPINTPYIVAIGAKHWRTIAAARGPDNLLVLKGHALYDPGFEGMSLFVTEAPIVLDPDDRIGAGTVKPPTLTVVGRVGEPLVRPDMTLIRMVFSGVLPALPKGLAPPSPPPATAVGLYISARMWHRVAEFLARDPQDVFIGEGTPYFDGELGMLAVNVSTATTRARDQAERAAGAP